jgi:hypothetical protein
LCTEDETAKCLAEFGETKHLEWACANCPKKRPENIDPYTTKLLRIRQLKKAGYPLKTNELTMEEWFDLGWMESWLQTPEF